MLRPLQQSVNASNAMAKGGEHVCVGCGVHSTEHPSMICQACATATMDAENARAQREDRCRQSYRAYSRYLARLRGKVVIA
jgi:hypothetical protein